MNSHDSSLRFPSGRPIGSVKKDAKKLARSAGIPLTSALNRLAAENGIDLPWSEAVQRLKASQTRPREAKVFSIYGPDLANIRKAGIAAQKETGKELELALYEAARDAGVDNAEEIATMAYKPIEKGTFHVAKIGGARLELWVSNGAFYDKTKRDLFINGGPIPGQAEKRRSDWLIEQVVWGDATAVYNRCDDVDGWCLCKYDPRQTRIPLLLNSDIGIKALETDIGVPANGQAGRSILESRAFKNLARWASEHPRISKGATSTYFCDWGNRALAVG